MLYLATSIIIIILKHTKKKKRTEIILYEIYFVLYVLLSHTVLINVNRKHSELYHS